MDFFQLLCTYLIKTVPTCLTEFTAAEFFFFENIFGSIPLFNVL